MPTAKASVPVRSALKSKINWLQVFSAMGTFATALIAAANLEPEQAAALTAGVALVGQVGTVVIRTFFTKAITPSSL